MGIGTAFYSPKEGLYRASTSVVPLKNFFFGRDYRLFLHRGQVEFTYQMNMNLPWPNVQEKIHVFLLVQTNL